MGFEKNDLIKKSLDAIKKHNLTYVSDVVAYLPCSRTCFYDKQLDKEDVIKDAIANTRINLKETLKRKWLHSENATLQMGLMKLICNDEEAHRLNGTKKEIKTEIIDHNSILTELEKE